VVEIVDELRPAGAGESAAPGPAVPQDGIMTLEESDRIHIRQALAATAGRLYGPDGAAALLGINPSTLRSRMKKLGITKQRV
jgi:transcriptional regulator with GAF, ATPase, and Fis domain